MKLFVIFFILFHCGMLHAYNITPEANSVEFDVTDNGVGCTTPCGQDGLFEDRYWCHTADSWDFCEPKYKVEKTKGVILGQNFHQTYVSSQKDTFLDRILGGFTGQSGISRQDGMSMMAGMGVLGLTAAVAGVAILLTAPAKIEAIQALKATTMAPPPAFTCGIGDNNIATLDAACSSRGSCNGGACACAAGFTGMTCGTPPAACDPANAATCGNANGVCLAATRICACLRGRVGPTCAAQCPTAGGTGCCSPQNLCAFGTGFCTANADCQGNMVCDTVTTNNCVCPPGTQQNPAGGAAQPLCTPCPAGQFTAGLGVACAVCTAATGGTASNIQQTACQAAGSCPANNAPGLAANQCTACAAGAGLGTTLPAAPAACAPCPSGGTPGSTITALDGITCIAACPAGQVQTVAGLGGTLSNQCLAACPAGQGAAAAPGAAAQCVACVAPATPLTPKSGLGACLAACPFGQIATGGNQCI